MNMYRSAGIATQGTCECPTPALLTKQGPSPVEEKFQLIQTRLMELGEVHVKLEQRLAQVLAFPPPSAPAAECPRKELPAMLNRLGDIQNALDSAISHVHDIMDRLQI